MPTHDFTLDELLAATAKQTEQIVDRSIERALIKEREHTRAMIDEVKFTITDEFSSFWDNNLAPVLEEMQDDVKVIKDVVKDHSFRLSRLETRLKPNL